MHKLLTTAQAAARLGVSRWKITRLVEAGELTPVTKLTGRNGAFLFDVAEIEARRRERVDS